MPPGPMPLFCAPTLPGWANTNIGEKTVSKANDLIIMESPLETLSASIYNP